MLQAITLYRNVPRDRAIESFAKFLRGLPQDKAWRVAVQEHKRKRSDAQNRYLWGAVYPLICKHLDGWDPEDVHEYFLGEHFGWQEIAGLGRRRVKPIRRSSQLSTVEFMDFVAFIQRRMAEHGVYVPDPGETIDE